MTRTSSATIRLAQPGDAAALGRLGAALMRLHYGFDRLRFLAPHDGAEAGYGRFLTSQLESRDSVVFVAELDEQVVGYVYAQIEPLSWKELRDRAGFVHDVIVDESARGLGLGPRLVEAASRWLQERGVPRVMLWTAEPNAAAQQMFEKMGFRRTMIEMTRECPEVPSKKGES